MTAYDFSFVKNTSIAFNATTDSINMGAISASTVEVSNDASGNLVLRIGSDAVTLQGASAAQVTTTNVTFGSASTRSAWVVGDNATGTTIDGIGNSLTEPAFAANQDNLFYGLGGADSIVAGNGNNVIFGGAGVVDSTDGADSITIGGGANTVYGNAGNDGLVDDNANASSAGTTSKIYMGLGNDSITLDLANAGDYEAYGNSGADNINITSSGTVTLFGGNGAVDATDGNDTLNASGTGNKVIYGNSGNDDIDIGATAANRTAIAYGGVDNDTIDAGGAASSTTTLYGNTGNDSITSTSVGNVTIFGGNGLVDSTDGGDTIDVNASASATTKATVYGNSGDDNIAVRNANGAAEFTVFAGLGNDTINVGLQTNGTTASANHTDTVTIIGLGAGNNRVNFDATAGELITINNFNATNDVIAFDLAAGTAANLSISNTGFLYRDADNSNSYQAATEEAINLSGLNGDLTATNLLLTSGGLGGASVGRVLTNFFGTAAATLTGSTAADLLVSGDLGDTLVSGGGNDKLVGNAGNDTFQVEGSVANAFDSATFTIEGGTGTDILELTGTTAVSMDDADFTTAGNLRMTDIETLKLANVTTNAVTLGNGASTVGINSVDGSASTGSNTSSITLSNGGGDVYSLTTFGFTGGAGNDSVNAATATATSLTLSMAAGDDRVTLTGGNDNVDMGAGTDIITVATANLTAADTLNGGDGTDTLSFDMVAAPTAISDSVFANKTNFEVLRAGDDDATSATTWTLGANAQASGIVTVNAASETTHGVHVDASAYTVALNVTGAGAASTITGGSAADVLTGGAGNDTIIGGNGNDIITGGDGQDSITAGAGSDTINLALANGHDNDLIVGFTAGVSGDVFDFTDLTVASFRGNGTDLQTGGTGAIALDANLGLLVFTNTLSDLVIGTVQTQLAASNANIAAGDSFLILASNGTDTGLYLFNDLNSAIGGITGNNDGNADVGEVQLYATLQGVTSTSAFTIDNFADITLNA